jgi:hypothetical protein
MTIFKQALLSAAILAGIATPALAEWNEIGTVRVSPGRDRDSRSFDLGGPVERLQLRADGSDINCRSVDARFGNGQTRSVFSGPLRDGMPVNVDLPGRERNITSLSFNCGAQNRRGGDIVVVADVGSHRGEWRRNPRWQSNWSKAFNWGSDMVNDWKPLSTVSFEGRNDRENSFAGWRGQNIEAVALKPLDADARCSRVTARFGNGQDQVLNVNNGNFMRRGQFYKLDLPGRARDLVSLAMRCRATDAARVKIQIFTSR